MNRRPWVSWSILLGGMCLCALAMLFIGFLRERTATATVQLEPEERQWLEQHDGAIRIVADPLYPPLDFVRPDGMQDGIAEDLFRLLELRLDVHFRRVNVSSWNDLLRMAENRELDVIKCANRTPNRERYMLFTENYTDFPINIIVRNDNPRDLVLSDLVGMRVAFTEGYSVQEYLARNGAGLRLVPVKNDSIALQKVAAGEVYAALCDLPTATYLIRQLALPNLRIAGELDHHYRLGIASRKDWPILNRILMKGLNSISEKEKNELFARWVRLEYEPFYRGRLFTLLLALCGTLLVGIVCMVVWDRTLRNQVRSRTLELNEYKDRLELLVEERTRDLQNTNVQLRDALGKVKTLSGFLPICAGCKKIREDSGYWSQIEDYIESHSEAEFSHGFCPDCAKRYYPGHADKIDSLAEDSDS